MKKEEYILEICSEDATNSWQFWQSQDKTEQEYLEIVSSIIKLVKDGYIFSTLTQYVKDRSYKEVPLDDVRLSAEVRASMLSENSDDVYWFAATEAGKKQDIINRSMP